MSGILYIIAAPSGAGKTSLVNALISSTPQIQLSISHTTRAPRPAERDGQHYFFVNDETFLQMAKAHSFLEHARVFDFWYGTSKEWVLQQLTIGFDVILEIDWQGAQQIKRLHPDTVMIFIFPPSIAVLAQRLRQRGQDDEAVIERRLAEARLEMSHYQEYDYLVVNDDFDTALSELKCIIGAERLRQKVQGIKKKELIAELLL